MAVEPKPYKFPKTFGACADRLHVLKTLRLAEQKKVDAIEAEENALKAHVIDNMPKSDGGAVGKTHKVLIIKKLVPRVENWDDFYKFVKKTGRFDLLQRRLGDAAILEMWDSKKKVPGVIEFQNITLSLTKV